MTQQILRLIRRPIEITRHSTSQIPSPDMNSHSGTPLITPSQIIRQPSDIPRKRWINPTCRDEDSGIYDAGETPMCRCCDGDDESDEDGAHGDEDEGCAADLGAVCIVGCDDCEAGGGNIDGHGEELSC